MTPHLQINIVDYLRERRFMVAGWIVGMLIFFIGWLG